MTFLTARRTTRGFSLLELLVALMIIAIISTLGFKKYQNFSAQARYVKAQDDLKTVAEGLDQYYLKHARYPDFGSFDAMVDGNSPLVKENLIKVGMSPLDPFKQPYEGKSSRGVYELKSAGDPDRQDEFGPITRTPSQGQVLGGSAGEGTPKSEAPAASGAPK
ncbi:type II secretion system protein GspG [Geothrix sp. 21YS21S-4]|uniref:type II secretion system protein GspG n=1 Tax=Geothrix sp. 21YS21S-4 TaxID=3068889 RepID=UPI0027BADB24|nr:prepilin-type N-terminal cleavage/methylation domain-containing protein [Geothrix sp. 21YS21S-4]